MYIVVPIPVCIVVPTQVSVSWYRVSWYTERRRGKWGELFAISLRPCYAMPGTDIAFAYALSGTDTANGTICLRCYLATHFLHTVRD
eukprot:2590014-Rhodomonas_salina.1